MKVGFFHTNITQRGGLSNTIEYMCFISCWYVVCVCTSPGVSGSIYFWDCGSSSIRVTEQVQDFF